MKIIRSGKRLLSMALALVMVFSLAPQVHADAIFLTEMRVEVTEPVVGKHPDFQIRVPADANYGVVEGGYWKDRDLDYLMRPEDVFQPGTEYILLGQLYPKPGYQMDMTMAYRTKLVVNGQLVNVEESLSGMAAGHMQIVFNTPGTAPSKRTATVTFKIQGGTWDGTDGKDKTASVLLIDNKGMLTEAQIPTGMKPLEGYGPEGSWDVVPSTAADGITEDVTYTYTFPKASADPVTAGYSVSHMLEQLDGSYVQTYLEPMTGKVGENTAAQAGTYEGFTAQSVTQAPITADGLTVVEIRYTRNVHTLTWDFQDGGDMGDYTHGEVRFGAPITASRPSKIGYTFGGWEPAVPETMPDRDLAFTALWIEQMPDPARAKYTVHHMLEKLGAAGTFEQVGIDERFGNIGENTVTEVRNYPGFTAQPVTQEKIAADGSTVVDGLANAYSLMVFCLLYIPCMATIATINREVGKKRITLGILTFQLLVAWLVAFVAFHVVGLFV